MNIIKAGLALSVAAWLARHDRDTAQGSQPTSSPAQSPLSLPSPRKRGEGISFCQAPQVFVRHSKFLSGVPSFCQAFQVFVRHSKFCQALQISESQPVTRAVSSNARKAASHSGRMPPSRISAW
jgi:hypothetical protein